MKIKKVKTVAVKTPAGSTLTIAEVGLIEGLHEEAGEGVAIAAHRALPYEISNSQVMYFRKDSLPTLLSLINEFLK